MNWGYKLSADISFKYERCVAQNMYVELEKREVSTVQHKKYNFLLASKMTSSFYYSPTGVNPSEKWTINEAGHCDVCFSTLNVREKGS